MLNVVCLMGRLGSDPELKYTPSQVPVTNFSIAVQRTYMPKNSTERPTDWIDIVAWRSTAEFISRYFRKGSMIVVHGSIQTRSYVDKDGNKRTAFEVVADNVFFGDSKRDGGASTPARYDSQIPQFNEAQPAFSNTDSSDFEEIVADDELPF
jgi:single-strand DNA-binding protein